VVAPGLRIAGVDRMLLMPAIHPPLMPAIHQWRPICVLTYLLTYLLAYVLPAGVNS
jgi:hypothetical protein